MSKSIMWDWKGCCYLCGKEGPTEEHHIFGGPNRKKSERYGLKVYLCPDCHRNGKHAVHKDAGTMQILHEAGQMAFELNYGHDEFMRVFGKNYLG